MFISGGRQLKNVSPSPAAEKWADWKKRPSRASLGLVLLTEVAHNAVDWFSSGSRQGENNYLFDRRPLHFLIVGPRPIFGYLMIPSGFVCFSYGFVMFLVDFNRRPSPDLWLSYDFLLFFYGLPIGFAMFSIDFHLRPSPDLRLSYDFLWFCMLFVWFCNILDRF